jgi:hypothetical protein
MLYFFLHPVAQYVCLTLCIWSGATMHAIRHVAYMFPKHLCAKGCNHASKTLPLSILEANSHSLIFTSFCSRRVSRTLHLIWSNRACHKTHCMHVSDSFLCACACKIAQCVYLCVIHTNMIICTLFKKAILFFTDELTTGENQRGLLCYPRARAWQLC